MQAGGGGGDGAALAGVDGLVTLGVQWLDRALEVGREWEFAGAVEVDRAVELHQSLAFGEDLAHDAGAALDDDAGAEAHLAAGFDQAFPEVLAERFQEEKLDAAVVGEEAR